MKQSRAPLVAVQFDKTNLTVLSAVTLQRFPPGKIIYL